MLIKMVGPHRVAILAMAEHEFSIAPRNAWGANPLDIIDFVRRITRQRDQYDFLVVLLHGSAEFHVPSPRIRNTCRFMVEMGANVVVVQHPHILGGYEDYLKGHIVYGQGALIMDEAIYRRRKSFHEGFLVKLRIADDRSSTMELVPFVQSDPGPGARKMNPEREREFLRDLANRSGFLQDDDLVEAEWISFCQQNKHDYLSALLGHNRLFRKLNSTGLLLKYLYGPKRFLSVRNCVSCETHREAIATIFEREML
jgi:poly-gamma-glutamate synthesis protein (capsule biosynthesis protein)